MGCKCGSQVILCNLPIRFDTYKGCSHGCRYCFAQKKRNIGKIERDETVEAMRSFIEGKRNRETAWCDWNIPIHWGGMSDPFQPVEKNIRASYECLKQRAEALAKARGLFVVQYGINLDDYGEVLLSAVAEQAQNIPDELDDLYITCGSGITASGVIVGIERYGKAVKNIHLISTAYDRREKVRATLQRYGAERPFQYHDLFHTPGFVYEKQQKMRVGGVKLHPQYEAKSMKYLVDHGLNTNNALFWIVGAEPRER